MKEKYLKIKDYIDLKELGKFGFKQRDDYEWSIDGEFDGVSFTSISVLGSRAIYVYDKLGLVVLFDLIQSGFVKKAVEQ